MIEKEMWRYFQRWISHAVGLIDLLFKTRRYEIAKMIFVDIYGYYNHRQYHNLEHIRECLNHLDSLFPGPYIYPAQPPLDLVMAIWFHDVIYDPKRNDNEERSAEFARESLNMMRLPFIADKVVELILATKHDGNDLVLIKASKEEIDLIIDIDLAIFGQNDRKFDDYEFKIRQEYAHVPDDVFRKKRAEILRTFLDQPRIFRTSFFHGRYEEQARANLERSIARLTA